MSWLFSGVVARAGVVEQLVQDPALQRRDLAGAARARARQVDTQVEGDAAGSAAPLHAGERGGEELMHGAEGRDQGDVHRYNR